MRFPGFPIYGSQQSTRYTTAESLRSTFGTNLVNELRVGATGGATLFSPEIGRRHVGLVHRAGAHPASIERRAASPNAGVTPTPSSREASTKNIENTLNWVKGAHTLSIGGAVHAG